MVKEGTSSNYYNVKVADSSPEKVTKKSESAKYSLNLKVNLEKNSFSQG